jgi:hypothetical protein
LRWFAPCSCKPSARGQFIPSLISYAAYCGTLTSLLQKALLLLFSPLALLVGNRNASFSQDLVRFVDLGRYLCETWAGQYWRMENLKSFDESLEKRFPESRWKAYYLMAIHENLTRIPKSRLRDPDISWIIVWE